MPELDNKLPMYLDGVLADTQGVPQLDGLVARTRHNLSVISGEGNAQNILGVADKATGGESAEEKETCVSRRYFYCPSTCWAWKQSR